MRTKGYVGFRGCVGIRDLSVSKIIFLMNLNLWDFLEANEFENFGGFFSNC